MPVRNEERYIARSLESILAQDYPRDRIEVIVADGQSTDGTRDILGGFSGRCSYIQIVENPARIVSTGLNAGIKVARGSILVRVDGHCEIAPDYVNQCVAHLLQHDIAGVGGPMKTIGETYCAEAIAVGMSSRFGVGDSAFRTSGDRPAFVDTVAFPAYRREVVANAGLFDEELIRNQDDEYNYRLREMGGRILLTPLIQSRYYSRSSLGPLWRQFLQYGFWKVRVMQKHPRQMRARQFIPPLFVIGVIGSVAVDLLFPTGPSLALLVAGSYLLVNLIASFWAASKTKLRYLPLLPLVFGAMHLGYGVGFLVGLAKFRGRWGDRTGLVPDR